MKFLSLILQFSLCLILIKAFTINNLDNIPLNVSGMYLLDAFDSDVDVDSCYYHQSGKKIYCSFKKEKYIEKQLYITIPLIAKTVTDFKIGDVITKTELELCYILQVYLPENGPYACSPENKLAEMHPFEIVEAGDTYFGTEYRGETRDFKVYLSDGSYRRLFYGDVHVEKIK